MPAPLALHGFDLANHAALRLRSWSLTHTQGSLWCCTAQGGAVQTCNKTPQSRLCRASSPFRGAFGLAHRTRCPAPHRPSPKQPPINGVVLTISAHSFIIMVIQKLTGCPPLTALQRGACMRRKGASKRPHVTGAVRVKGRRSARAIWREPKGFHCAFSHGKVGAPCRGFASYRKSEDRRSAPSALR